MNIQLFNNFKKQLQQVSFDIKSPWAGGALAISGGLAAASLMLIAFRLGPISKQAVLWNICVQEEINHLQILSATNTEKIWLSVPNCNGGNN